MNDIITYEEYLAHYGVKGMKWGRRKGSKKPLSARKTKKVEKLERKADTHNAHLKELRKLSGKPKVARDPRYHRQVRQTMKKRDRADYDAKAIKAGKLTVNQKRAVRTAVAAGIFFAPDIIVGSNNAMHNIAGSKRKRDRGRAAASRLSDMRGINNFRTVDLSLSSDGEWR